MLYACFWQKASIMNKSSAGYRKKLEIPSVDFVQGDVRDKGLVERVVHEIDIDRGKTRTIDIKTESNKILYYRC